MSVLALGVKKEIHKLVHKSFNYENKQKKEVTRANIVTAEPNTVQGEESLCYEGILICRVI